MSTEQSHKKTAWQLALANAITDPKELLTFLELDEALLAPAYQAARIFPLKVPRGFAARMRKGDSTDPLLRQVLPLDCELQETSGYAADPLQEARFNPTAGLLHKYHGRVLLTLTGACGINCRYCFRREFPYEKNNPGSAGWQNALDYIARDSSITEVILSGGDPLVANDGVFKKLLTQLDAIPHLTRLRIHSRMPIVLPERITPELSDCLKATRLKTVLVVHCNHAQEINADVRQALQQLTKAGVLLLNQSVLLRGVNDDATTLINLSEALFMAGVQPYYLHLLDKVRGAAHFDLPFATACQLHQAMAERLPGYLVPKLACEQPDAPAKKVFGTSELYTD